MPKTHGTPGPRIIVPDCCTSQSLAKCSMGAQLLFDRLIVQSDDQGRQQGEPSIVKAVCFPYLADATPKRIAAWLGELASAGMVTLYAVGGVPIIQLTGWWTYQAGMRRAYPSRWPAPPDWTDRVFGLTKAEQGEDAGNLPAERGQPAGNPPHSAPEIPPRARGSGAGASAGAGAGSTRPQIDSRYGLTHVTPAVAALGERITGHSVLSAGDRQATELDRLVEDHGEEAVLAAMGRFAGGRRVSWRQLVWDGLVKSLEPFSQAKPLTDEQRKDAEIAAYVAAANARAAS